jgi:hypothetical protein
MMSLVQLCGPDSLSTIKNLNQSGKNPPDFGSSIRNQPPFAKKKKSTSTPNSSVKMPNF